MAVCHRFFKRLLQAGLDNVDVAALQRFDGFRIHVKAAYLEARFREGDRGRQTDIAQPHDSNFHNFQTSLSTVFEPLYHSVCRISTGSAHFMP